MEMETFRACPKYAEDNCTVGILGNDLLIWFDIDNQYQGKKFRDKVIYKIDAMYLLKSIFKPETIRDYRNHIFNIISGYIDDAETVSGIILALAKMDNVFASKLNEYYYTCDFDCSFGEFVLKSIAQELVNQEERFREFFKGKTESVICLSYGYLYICVRDYNTPIEVPEKVVGEVLSYAKNWNGYFEWPGMEESEILYPMV